jgi:putative FmdB family regulatory protein
VPIYDYDCSSCRTRTEFIHGIDAPAPRFCPACGAEGTLRKAFAPPAVHFKGSGWAKKDRSSATKTKAAAAAAGGDRAEGKGDGAKAAAVGEGSGSMGGSSGESKPTSSDGRSSSTATKSSTAGES